MDSFIKDFCRKHKIDNATEVAFLKGLQSIFTHQVLRSELRSRLESYDQRLEIAHNKNEFLDTEKAKKLKAKCVELLDWCDANPNTPHLSYLLAGIAYFLKHDDGHNDFESLDGLDDDKMIIDSLIEEFSIELNKETQIA